MGNYRFNDVPLVQYGDNLITDLSRNLTVEWTSGNAFFIDYTIQDGDTAENICYRLWEDSSLSWVIYLVNQIIDPFFDWPMRGEELMEYVKFKYGNTQADAIHHYEKDGFVVNRNRTDPTIRGVTNYEYEFRENDKRRKIILPTDDFMTAFMMKWGAK